MNKTCTKCFVEKSIADFYRAKMSRDGLRSCCKVCMLETNRKWAEANPEKAILVREEWAKRNKDRRKKAAADRFIKNKERFSDSARKWRECNRERHLENGRKWAAKNAERKAETNRKYRIANAEKLRASIIAWNMANPERAALNNYVRAGRRRAAIKNAIPGWANKFFIKEIYHLAKLRTKATGFKWHVDHIVPLQSRLVCGLHVEHNLQVIPAVENHMKKNCYWPDMP